MRFNEHGQYQPYLTGECTSCGLCSAVCPFLDGSANEDELGKILFERIPGIKHRVETGYYLDTFVGYVADPAIRWNRASGGMATWLLQKLLTEKAVDAVLCVSPNDDPNQLFRYKVCTTADEIQKCSRSCYYPVTTQEVLAFVATHAGRYAIMGLPCVCKAIRLAQQELPRLRDRVKYVLGLVCGQTKSKSFAEYICALGGGNPHRLSKVVFRVKDTSRSASDFGLRFTCGIESGSRREGTVFWTQGMNRAWSDRYFTPNACNFCDDVFAECADAVFMDAWLPEYRKDPKGHSLILTRDAWINGLFEHELEHPQKTVLRRIQEEKVIRCQMGVLCSKRGGMRDRISRLRQTGLPVPVKRWNTCAWLRPLGIGQLNLAQYQISRQSRVTWLECGKDLDAFQSSMQDAQRAVDRARRRYLSYRIPNAVLLRAGLYRRWATTDFYS
jgi:coenzyme F420-reducing hydrogenase beta subunit